MDRLIGHCPKCGSGLKVEHYLYKNLLYRSRLVCITVQAGIDFGFNKNVDAVVTRNCDYILEFPLPTLFWSEDLAFKLGLQQ